MQGVCIFTLLSLVLGMLYIKTLNIRKVEIKFVVCAHDLYKVTEYFASSHINLNNYDEIKVLPKSDTYEKF